MSRIIAIFCLSFLITSVWADNLESHYYPINKQAWHPLISLSGGLVNGQVAQTQTISAGSSPAVQNLYTPQHTHNNQVTLSLFAGAEYAGNSRFITQMGVGYYLIPNSKVSGTLEQSLASASNSYNYQYTLSTQQLLVEGKLLYKWRHQFLPYLSVGLGTAFNHAGDYSATPQNETAGPPPLFAAHNQTSFSYSFGLGIEMAVQPQLRVGVGYRFSNLGSISLANQNDSGSLQNKNYYTNAALVNLTYLF